MELSGFEWSVIGSKAKWRLPNATDSKIVESVFICLLQLVTNGCRAVGLGYLMITDEIWILGLMAFY